MGKCYDTKEEDWKPIFQKEMNWKLKLGLDKLKIGNITLSGDSPNASKMKESKKK